MLSHSLLASFLVVLALTFSGCAGPVTTSTSRVLISAQRAVNMTEVELGEIRKSVASESYADTLRALVVFVKFSDDTSVGDPFTFYREWPSDLSPSTIPEFGNRLLSASEEPPFDLFTLTDYFYQQSLGNFILYGDVYPKVLISSKPEASYHRPVGGYGDLAVEVLERLDPEVEFQDYDRNGDGKLDHLFLIIRRDSQRDAKKFVWTGISCLDARCGGQITAGKAIKAPSYDDVLIDWGTSGSIIMHRTPGNVDAHSYHIRMMAHELGHDIWAGFFNHIQSIRTNDVPLESNRAPNRGRNPSGTASLGFVLMAGAGGGLDTRGDETISAFERDLLGWISCSEVTSDTTILVRDLYTTSDCYSIPHPGAPAQEKFYVTNRQRLGYFDQHRRSGLNDRFEIGFLRTTGLLIHMSQRKLLDVIPADNSADLSVTNADYDGDLFGPDGSKQLTPWTRPNSSGYTKQPPKVKRVWLALDNIRYSGAADKSMLVDVVMDFRQAPIIRNDSWMTSDLNGYVFDSPIRVTDGSTLSIDADIVAGQGIAVDPGATLVVEENGRVSVPEGSAIILQDGRIVINGEVDGHIDARESSVVERSR